MKYLDLTLPLPEQNLACDEALLDMCEDGFPDEILRFWEPPQHFVVLGYSNKARSEVNLDLCRARRIPVLRRCSGGGTVVQGPGSVNYALILKFEGVPHLAGITETNNFVMERNRTAIEELTGLKVEIQGHTDLAVDHLKFSGNSQRRKRRFLLFHGTFLLNFELPIVEALLPMPSRQPIYRKNRKHTDFLMNLPTTSEQVRKALKFAWGENEPLSEIPRYEIDRLVKEKYATDEWNLRC